ncbi:hypothetical protein JFT43_00555 [Pseudomonas carnis]|nr:hypothetical protein [Pseudomonas carnis]
MPARLCGPRPLHCGADMVDLGTLAFFGRRKVHCQQVIASEAILRR